jgi:hypothetical protein
VSTLEAADAPFRLSAPIEHITRLDDGTVLAHVVVTSERPDSQGEVVDYDAFKEAAPDLMKWAVLGEMHDPERNDAGTILRLYLDDENRRAEADVHVVDPTAVKKVLNRVYKMVSLGGTKLMTRIESSGGRPLRRIVKLRAEELSLVPIGANADAMIRKQFVLAKMGDAPMEEPETPTPLTLSESDRQALIDTVRETLAKAESADPDVGGGRVRSEIPRSDFVFPEDAPDGGFPITSAGDVSDAVSSWGRYTGPHSFEEFKRRLTRIARRKGYPLPQSWQEERKMAKAARKAAALAADEQTEEPIAKADAPDGGDGDGEAPFPGAKAPFKGGKKAARKAKKLRKAAARKAMTERVERFAKGKNKTLKNLAEALEAVTCALSEEADEGDAKAVKALTDIANGVHEQMMIEAAEVHPEDDDVDVDVEPEEVDDEAPIAYAKARRRAADAAPRLAKRLRKSRRAVARLRKSRTALRRERAQLRKAALFTSVLTKSGARNSAADMAKIDAIHEATVELGTSAHKVAETAPAEVTADPMTKSSTATPSVVDQMRQALAEVLPAEKLDALEARLVALDEKSAEHSTSLAKIAKQPTDGGPYTAVYRGPQDDGSTAGRGAVLAKAAELIDDPRLRTEVASQAALDLIQSSRSTQ